MELNRTGVENLSIAIVKQAVDDYGRAKSGKHVDRATVLAIEKFFRSSMCELMTGLDGDTMIYLVNKKFNFVD